MIETLEQRAQRYIECECVSRGEWTALVRELLAALKKTDAALASCALGERPPQPVALAMEERTSID